MIIFVKTIPLLVAGKKVEPRAISNDAWQLILPVMLTTILVELIEVGGLLLLIIPGLIFFVWYEFAYVIVALENTSIMDSLRQSRALSRGRFWQVFWRMFAGLFSIFLIYLIGYVLVFYIGFLVTDLNFIDYAATPPTLIEEVLYRLVEIFVFPLFVIFHTLLYLTLKKTKLPAKLSEAKK